MALTIALVDQFVTGNKRVVINDVTMDNSYQSGGEPLTPAQLGLSFHVSSQCNLKAIGGTTNIAEAYYDGALLRLWDETPAEVAGAQDVSTCTVRIRSEGR